MDMLNARQDGSQMPEMEFIFDGVLCSKPQPSALITATLITTCVGIVSLLSPQHRHRNLSLVGGVCWAGFYLAFLAMAFYEACWFSAVSSWAIHTFNPLRTGPEQGTARAMLHLTIFAIMMVGTLMMVGFWLLAVVINLLKLASIFRRDRVPAKRKSIL